LDAKYLEEIKEHTEEAQHEGFGLQQFDDLNALIAEVEDQTARANICEHDAKTWREDRDRLWYENAVKDQQIDTLKRALELACEDQLEHCPYTLHGGKRVCSEYPMRGLRCQGCAPKYFIQQAQEQEGK